MCSWQFDNSIELNINIIIYSFSIILLQLMLLIGWRINIVYLKILLINKLFF